MNLNQAAHGDREFGYIADPARASPRKTVVGHVSRPGRHRADRRLGAGARRLGRDARRCKLARFGDNMRNVAVTEGDKTEAELRFGVSVNTWGVNDLVAAVDAVADADVDALVAEYVDLYDVAPSCARAATGTSRCATAPGIEVGAADVPRGRRLRRVHHELRGPRRAAPAARASPCSG